MRESTGEDDSEQFVHCVAQRDGPLIVEQFGWWFLHHQRNLDILPGCKEDASGEGLIDNG
eukprot:1617469-Rhodomonas_salina.1